MDVRWRRMGSLSTRLRLPLLVAVSGLGIGASCVIPRAYGQALPATPNTIIQQLSDSSSSPPDAPPRGAQLLLPLGSLMLAPGLGQYVQGALAPGLAFSATALVGVGLFVSGDTADLLLGGIPRSPDQQRAFLGAQLCLTAGALSAYDSFHRSIRLLRRQGKYAFLTAHEPTGSLLTAPFDVRFVRRWTTLLDLAYTAAVTAIARIVQADPDAVHEPLHGHDALFLAALSYDAGVGEEALFRGWLYPLLYQNTGRRFWIANTIQAATFGALHPQAGEFAIAIGAWAFYEGWVTRRNGWSVRESIFHHFWYDVAVSVATVLADERKTAVIAFPPVRF